MKLALYSAVGDELTHYAVDVAAVSLSRQKTVVVPSTVQYVWPHPSRRFLYVATSNRGAGLKADHNHLSAYRIDPQSGALTRHGEPQPLPQRAQVRCRPAREDPLLDGDDWTAMTSTRKRWTVCRVVGPAVMADQDSSPQPPATMFRSNSACAASPV